MHCVLFLTVSDLTGALSLCCTLLFCIYDLLATKMSTFFLKSVYYQFAFVTAAFSDSPLIGCACLNAEICLLRAAL